METRRHSYPAFSVSGSGHGSVSAAVRRAYFRFYAELNDHLRAADQFKLLEKRFYVSGAVMGMIESSGVSHTEVAML
jgi:hypothetical protein